MDPASVRGTGPGGRIVEADVLRAALGVRPAPAGPVLRGVGQRTLPPSAPVIASPHFYLQATADVTVLLDVQRQVAEEVQRACGAPLRLADLLLRAMALALADCPQANCVWQDGTLVELGTADVGFEVEGASGRVTPVIRQADRLRLLDLVCRRAELAAAARAGSLPLEATQGAATSLCDLSEHPVDQCTAVLLPPRSSVVAAGRAAARPMVLDNQLCMRQTIGLSLTADPRALSPETAAALLGRIADLLQRPFVLLCERPQ